MTDHSGMPSNLQKQAEMWQVSEIAVFGKPIKQLSVDSSTLRPDSTPIKQLCVPV